MSLALFFTLALSPSFVFSYNVDVINPIIHTSPEPRGSNYFGYTVSLSSDPASLLVGAPRASAEEDKVYRCPSNETGNEVEPKCHELKIDRVGKPGAVKPPRGILLPKDCSNVTICAPHSLVTAQSLAKPIQLFYHDMQGYCYNYEVGNIPRRDRDIRKSTVKGSTDSSNFNRVYGFSVHYAENKGKNFGGRIIGKPRLNEVEINHGHQTFTKSEKIDDRANLGYAVSSGYFFDETQLCFAAGAPGWLGKGKVTIYSSDSAKEPKTIRGSVLGEYFGASLAAGDFDGDGLDDLAVGAPHSGEVDFGQVYIFHGNRASSPENFKAGKTLRGASGNGQFGYTLAAVDLDRDNFTDLVVSAPWEGSGVVYVYYGHRDFRKQHSSAQITQRIDPSKFIRQSRVERFGFSLSNFVDLDANGYPDLAIGSYKSGHAIILRSKLVIRAEVNLDYNPIALTKSTTSFNVSVCVQYHGERAPLTQELDFEMTVDADHKRVENGVWQHFTHRFRLDQLECTSQTITLKPGIINIVDPIVIDVKYDIKKQDGTEFCSSCPVLSGNAFSKHKRITIPFTDKKPNDNDNYKSVLYVDAGFEGAEKSHGRSYDWIAGSGEISLNVTIRNTNEGEPAYMTELIIDMPSGVLLRNANPNCREGFKGKAISLRCAVGNPLGRNEKKNLKINLNMQHIVELATGMTLNFDINKTTRSEDEESGEPTRLKLTVHNKGYLTVTGSTDGEIYDYGRTENETEINIRHHYKVSKFGSRMIKNGQFKIDVPTSIIGRNDSFLNMSDPMFFVRSETNNYDADKCHKDDSSFGNGQYDAFRGEHHGTNSLQRRRREVIDDDQSTESPSYTSDKLKIYDLKRDLTTDRTVYLNCSTEGIFCTRYTCYFSFLDISETNGNVALEMVLDADSFYTSKEDSLTVEFSTNASVEIERISDPTFLRNTAAEVATILFNQPAAQAQKLAGWIIPVSIIFGLIIFGILAFILFKVGFFNRPKKMETDQAREMGMILKASDSRS